MRTLGLQRHYEIVASGQFHCPKCNVMRYYQQKCAVKHTFWLFGREQVVDEYVECLVCKQSYQLEVLQYNSGLQTDRLMLSIKYALESGVSVDTLLDGLVYSGMNVIGAVKLVNSASVDEQKSCPNCGIEQVGSLLRCKQCSVG